MKTFLLGVLIMFTGVYIMISAPTNLYFRVGCVSEDHNHIVVFATGLKGFSSQEFFDRFYNGKFVKITFIDRLTRKEFEHATRKKNIDGRQE